jgi:hypothetical protein
MNDELKQLALDLPERPYELRISRLTVDKLGVKLYDKVSAVVSELVANGYDADAEQVVVRLPLNTILATERDGNLADRGYTIEVIDNGHGMTPDEAIDFFLKVGRNRRDHIEQGGRSRVKQRPVMGRKGIGKLAPFGICARIEVKSAGGPQTDEGYRVTHFFMDYDKIVSEDDRPVQLDPGPQDRSYDRQSGTVICLSDFQSKRVPDADTFHRQLAARFVFAKPDFEILVEDTRNPVDNPPQVVKALSVPVHEETRIDLSTRPIVTESEEELHASGWLAMAKESYRNEEMAGVRIYARGKIVATTRDFEQPAGFTGEFTIRSYLVGVVHAEWLDMDDGEDLVRSDRQGILWESEYGRALRSWGASLIKEIGRLSKEPRRVRARDAFMVVSDFAKRAKDRFSDEEVVSAAMDLASQVGALAAPDELQDEDYINDLSEVILSVAPHKALIGAFQEFAKSVTGNEVTLERLLDLFGKTRIAEMASYSQITAERVKAIRELEKLVHSENVVESEFQRLLARAPWLIEPTWSVISKNQALKNFKKAFESYWQRKNGEEIVLAIGEEYERVRPDFTLVNVGHKLHVVEIKKPNHNFDDSDYERLLRYVLAFRDFFSTNVKVAEQFSAGWQIDLVADGVNLKSVSHREAFDHNKERKEVFCLTWEDFLTRAITAHEAFLEINDRLSSHNNGDITG